MPYKDPEVRRNKAREYARKAYEPNREKILAQRKHRNKERFLLNPERYREIGVVTSV